MLELGSTERLRPARASVHDDFVHICLDNHVHHLYDFDYLDHDHHHYHRAAAGVAAVA